MAYRKVDAARGVEWIKQSVELLMGNPAPFALMGLVLAVISAVPVLGGLAMLVLGPALYAGIMTAARNQQASGNAQFTDLFAAFQQEGKLPGLLALCLPAVVAMIVVGIFAAILVGGALLGGALSAGTGNDGFAFAALGLGGGVLVLVALAVGLVAHALVFFAIARTMFDALEPFAAMKESGRAVVANIGAVLLFVALLLGAVLVLVLVLGWISTLLMQLVVAVVVLPVAVVGMYMAWRDVYALGAAAAPADVPGDVPPPPAPAPAAVDGGAVNPPASPGAAGTGPAGSGADAPGATPPPPRDPPGA